MVIVAPNSPSAFAYVRIADATIPFLHSGRVTVINALDGEAPRVLATSSYLAGISSMAALIRRIAIPTVVMN